jgi:hypothetical protein
MNKIVFLLSVFLLSLNSSNGQCKKLDVLKLVQLRSLQEKQDKKTLEEGLGFTEDKNSSMVLSFNRECTDNGK